MPTRHRAKAFFGLSEGAGDAHVLAQFADSAGFWCIESANVVK
jgi:hypothetical protein